MEIGVVRDAREAARGEAIRPADRGEEDEPVAREEEERARGELAFSHQQRTTRRRVIVAGTRTGWPAREPRARRKSERRLVARKEVVVRALPRSLITQAPNPQHL